MVLILAHNCFDAQRGLFLASRVWADKQPHGSAGPHDQGAKDFLNTRSNTRCPSLRPRVSNFVSGREPALAKSEAVLISEGSDKNTSSICRAYSSQSVQACTVAPGFILEASSATNSG